MQFAFVLNPDRTPSVLVQPFEARQLLKNGQASVLKRYPFTLILREQSQSSDETYSLKIAPTRKQTGIALVRQSDGRVVWAAELEHRSDLIIRKLKTRADCRRSRRSRKTRYRPSRFNNRLRREGWLPPSVQSRVENIVTWAKRIISACQVAEIIFISARFDVQRMRNPDISGIEYQQGTLFGYEIREYLIEKWDRQCAYCKKPTGEGRPGNIDHIQPRSKGGTNSITNLVWSCQKCNQAKNNLTIQEFLAKKPALMKSILAQVKMPMKEEAYLNAMKNETLRRLSDLMPTKPATMGQAKYHRIKQKLPAASWIHAACAGINTPVLNVSGISPLSIKAFGHGCRQAQGNDKYGFPSGSPKQKYKGFKTGDIVIAQIPTGKNKGTHIGRITTRSRPSFDMQMRNGKKGNVHAKYMKTVHKADGYSYAH